MWTVVLLAGGLFGALVWFEYAAVDLDAQAEREWATTLGFEPDEMLGRFPKVEENEAARNVNRFVARLDLMSPEARSVWDVFISDRVVESVGDEIARPPESARRFLDAHAADFATFYDEVLAGETPRWEVDISKHLRAPSPNSRVLSALVNAIAADALYKASGGRHVEALRAVDAAWKIDGGLRDRPDLISQLIANSGDGVLVCALRKIANVPPEWQERMVSVDRRRALYVALAVESWALREDVEEIDDIALINGLGDEGRTKRGRLFGRALTTVLRSYLRYCAATASIDAHATVEGLENRWPGEIRVQNLPEIDAFAWNPWDPETLSVGIAQGATSRYLFLADVSRAVLRAKELRRAGTARATIDSVVVVGGAWDYAPEEEAGAFTLVFEPAEELSISEATMRYRTIGWSPAKAREVPLLPGAPRATARAPEAPLPIARAARESRP
jgi:hypothetical protein